MKATEMKKGMIIIFESGDYKSEFTIEKVTGKRISWYNGHPMRSYKNMIKMTWVSLNEFQKGLDSGAYKIKE